MTCNFWPGVLSKRKAVFIIIIALFVVLNVVLYVLPPTNSFVADDTNGYLEAASEWVTEGKYGSGIRLPGYPMLLAAWLPASMVSIGIERKKQTDYL